LNPGKREKAPSKECAIVGGKKPTAVPRGEKEDKGTGVKSTVGGGGVANLKGLGKFKKK